MIKDVRFDINDSAIRICTGDVKMIYQFLIIAQNVMKILVNSAVL